MNMFRKVHLRLTFLCAAITIGILCLFAGLYLYIAESTLKENHSLSFQQDMDSLSASLSQQVTISSQYLLRQEKNGNYMIFVWDDNIPYLFNELTHNAAYYEMAETLYREYQDMLNQEGDAQVQKDTHTEYLHRAPNGDEYNVSLIRFPPGQLSLSQNDDARDNTGISILVISPRSGFLQQLYTQRLWFLLISAAGCILMTFFAWFFTGRLLRPIQENQRRQIQFVSDASHELRTPLAVIRSCISIQPPHYEETILQECVHMGRLVEELLTLSRLEDKSLSLQREALEPDTLVLNLYEQMEPLAQEKGLRLAVSLPEEPLPCCLADPGRLRQLLMILLQNAFSYTPAGGKISLSVSAAGKKGISFQVSDTGPGISDEDKDRVFERFYRSDASHTDKGHFGLGLCIAREIVQAHQGHIAITDTPGGGCTITVTIP